jgi:hypothetical protein
MTAARGLNVVSVEDYLERELFSESKHEFVCGAVYVMPEANNLHNRIRAAGRSRQRVSLTGRIHGCV